MRLNVVISSIVGMMVLLASCMPAGNQKDVTDNGSTVPQAQQAYHKITAEEAKEMMDAGGVTVVDVRTQAEYDERHIPGAVLVPNETIEGMQPDKLPDKEAVLLIYCRTGVRSKQASDKLVQLGYTNVYDFGGISSWPYETSEEGEQ